MTLKNLLNIILTSLIPVIFISCNPTVTIPGLDKDVWINDKYACEGFRTNYLEIIENNKTDLLQLNQNEVEVILGGPDEHELDKRKRKYYYYYLEPGPLCRTIDKYPIRLQIKFNALGVSSEVFLENY